MRGHSSFILHFRLHHLPENLPYQGPEMDTSLFECDVGYFEAFPEYWVPGKIPPGIPLNFTKRGIEAAMKLDFRDTDILVDSFPKTGQTWTLAIMGLIQNAQEIEAGKELGGIAVSGPGKIPFLETEMADGLVVAEMAQHMPFPRVLKSHLPMQALHPENYPNLKIIQTIRNPKDTLVSLFHFIKMAAFGCYTGTFDDFFKGFKEKALPMGDIFKFTLEWYKFNKDRQNSLIVKYEDMIADHRGHVIKLAKFMGHNLSDSVVDYIVEKTKKKEMRKEWNDMARKINPVEKVDMVRKGIVGDWVNYFSPEQSDYVDALCKEHFEPLGITFEC